MGMAVQRARRWTAGEVRDLIARNPRWTPRYELVDGELLMTPSPGPRHQAAVTLLLVALHAWCEATGVGRALASPSDIELGPEDIRQPDVFILPTHEWTRVLAEGFPARELLLAVEVTSPSSARFDRVAKRPLYQRRVDEYWIVDPDSRLIERWQRSSDRPDIVTRYLEWTTAGASAPFLLDVAAFFRSIWPDDAEPR